MNVLMEPHQLLQWPRNKWDFYTTQKKELASFIRRSLWASSVRLGNSELEDVVASFGHTDQYFPKYLNFHRLSTFSLGPKEGFAVPLCHFCGFEALGPRHGCACVNNTYSLMTYLSLHIIQGFLGAPKICLKIQGGWLLS